MLEFNFGTLSDRLQILFLILSELISVSIPPESSKATGCLVISGGIEVDLLKFA